MERATCTQGVGGLADAGLIVHVQARLGSAVQAHHLGAAGVGAQGLHKGLADATTGADDQGAKAEGKGIQRQGSGQGVVSLSSAWASKSSSASACKALWWVLRRKIGGATWASKAWRQR
mgnify:CR=1 FL=1